MEYLRRLLRIIWGLFLYAIGSYLNIQANVGLGSWEAFSVGVSDVTGIMYGNVVVLTGVVILIIDLLLKEKIGFGTILDTLLIGKFVDIFNHFDFVPMIDNFFIGIIVLIIGQISICIGTYFYISGGLGCGPRDTLMVALAKRFPKVSIGFLVAIIEGSAILIGALLGAKIGIGTIIYVFGISFLLDLTFRILKFDVKKIEHESVICSVKKMAY